MRLVGGWYLSTHDEGYYLRTPIGDYEWQGSKAECLHRFAELAVIRHVERVIHLYVRTVWDGEQLIVLPAAGWGERVAWALAYVGVPTSFADHARLRVLADYETIYQTLTV